MSPADYIGKQPTERRQVLTDLHAAILRADKTVNAVVEPMMGKEMIIYKASGMMKYALSSVKKYMSLHLLPMYMSPVIAETYKPRLSQADFQKGCINFSDADGMPLPVVQKIIEDCAVVDVLKIRNDYLLAKKAKK